MIGFTKGASRRVDYIVHIYIYMYTHTNSLIKGGYHRGVL